MIQHKEIIFIIIFLLTGSNAILVNGQSFPEDDDFVLYSVKDGLPDNSVKAIEQDDQGFIWVGTPSGLSCFDGVHFTNYYKSDDFSTSLASDYIHNLTKRPDGKIYAGTFNGLSLLDPIKRTFKSVRVSGIDSLTKNANSFGLVTVLPNGEVIAGSLTGIFVFDENLNLTYQYIHYKPSDIGKVRMQFVNSIISLSDGNCLITGNAGFWLYHTYEHHIEKIETPFMGIRQYLTMKSIGVKDIGAFLDPSMGADTLILADTKRDIVGRTNVASFTPNDFYWAVQYKLLFDSLLLITSHLDGAFLGVLDQKSLTTKINPVKRLRPYHIANVFMDSEKRIWLGTQYGLMAQSFTKQQFRHHLLSIIKNDFHIDPIVQGITRIGDRFYAGVQDHGIWVLDKNFTTASHLDLGTVVAIWNLDSRSSDTLFVGSQTKFFYTIPGDKKHDIHQLGPNGSTFAQFRDRSGNIWAGFHGGVLRYDTHADTTQVWSSNNPEHYFPYNDAWSITETDSGYIWMCGDGWHRWNPYKNEFDRYLTIIPGTENQEGISYNVASNGGEELIFSLFNNGIWKWTPGNHAEKLKISNRSFEFADEILRDRTPHCFWLLLKAGIGYLNVETGQYRFFNENSGLPAGEVMSEFFFDKKTDSIYIGMDNGILAFKSSDFAFSDKQPSVFITGMTFINHNALQDLGNSIKVPPSDRDFLIRFSCPEYEYASNIRYEYRLSNQTWTDVGSASLVQFANLGAGQYHFEVRASSPNGMTGKPAILMFTILPFYYETWWFRILLLLIASTFIYLLFRRRINQLQQLEKIRQSIAADLHDEVGATLTSVQILAELAGQHKSENDHADVLARLKANAKKATASLREIVWNIHPKNDLLEVFTGELIRYAGEILEDAGITYNFQVGDFNNGEKLKIETRQQLARVYKEIISNLVKHSHATHADLSFRKESHQIVITIQDNGNGFNPELVERGNGLNNITDRMKMIKGNLRIKSGINLGTKISFSAAIH